MTNEKREELLARSMVGRYRLGYEQVALYLAGVLFEAIINRKVAVHCHPSTIFVRLEKKIAALWRVRHKAFASDSLFIPGLRHVFTHYYTKNAHPPGTRALSNADWQRTDQVRERLDNFRWLRNKIMHGEFEKIKETTDCVKDDLILYVWSELAPGSFIMALKLWEERKRKGRIVDVLFEHTADYMIRGIDEIDIRAIDEMVTFNPSTWSIEPDDFANLFVLRRKMAALKKHLQKWQAKHADFLHTNTLTTIDTTSGYIWMPLTRLNTETQEGIFTNSVSILATPLDFRIYMDFGGMADRERQLYFDYLQSAEYQRICGIFTGRPDFYVFDTEWYCFITKKRLLDKWSASAKAKDIKQAQGKLKPILGNLKDPITWNRMLHGFILDQQYLCKVGYLDIFMIEKRLSDIILLFRSFESYKAERAGNHEKS